MASVMASQCHGPAWQRQLVLTSRRNTACCARVWRPRLPGLSLPDSDQQLSSPDPYNTDLGIYQGDPSALHFPERKSGILRLKDPAAEGDESKDRCLQTTHAEPCFLRIVSFTHYLAFATQLAVALAYFNYVQPAATVAHAAAVHVPFDGALPFLLVAGPLFQAMGGAGPNVMHEYEGFMVSPFQAYPLKQGSSSNSSSSQPRPEYNNDTLRQVAYRSLFQLQAIGALMFGLGALWPHAALPTPYAWGVLGAFGVALYCCPRKVFYLTTKLGNVELLWPPLPTWPLVLFVPGIILQTCGLVHLLGWEAGLAAGLLLAFGGILEAGLAEGTYDQRWHLLAVIMLNSGGWVQVASLYDWWSSPVFCGVAGAVVLSALTMTAAALNDLVKSFWSDSPGNELPKQ